MTALTKTIDSAMATLRACREAREEAQSSLVAVRARLRDVGDEIREKTAAAKPLRDVVDAATRREKSSSCEGASWGDHVRGRAG